MALAGGCATADGGGEPRDAIPSPSALAGVSRDVYAHCVTHPRAARGTERRGSQRGDGGANHLSRETQGSHASGSEIGGGQPQRSREHDRSTERDGYSTAPRRAVKPATAIVARKRVVTSSPALPV